MLTFQGVNRYRLLLVAIVGIFLAVWMWSTVQAEEGSIELPESYMHDHIYSPNLAGLSGLVTSQSGRIYVRHLGQGGEVRVSQLDVDQATLTRILTLPPWVSAHAIVGGPGDSFFIEVGSEIRQVQPDGSYTLWNSSPPAGMIEYFTQDGRMLGIGQGGTAVIEMFPDGSYNNLLSGLSAVYDVIANNNGDIFISDFPAGKLIHLDDDHNARTVTTIAKDNTDLAIDQQENLYINSAPSGFARVDLVTGEKTVMTAPNAACPAVLSPALVLFDNSNRAVFGSWVANEISWADFATGNGGRLVHQSWANTPAADIGPDDALYMGVTGCGSAIPTQIVRFTETGESKVVVDGLTGNVSGFAVDNDGGYYISLGTETSAGVYYVAPTTNTALLVPGTAGVDTASLAVHPHTNHLFALRGGNLQLPPRVVIAEYTAGGEVLYEVEVPKAPQEFLIDFAPDGTLSAYASEAERFFKGPYVDRWILNLDLDNGTSNEVASVTREGCCPFGGFSVDGTGVIWWLLNPDSLLYQVAPGGGAEIFASDLPVDAAYANRSSQGDIFLNTPEGLHRIWIPTAGERVQLVIDIVDQFVLYDVLNSGQGRALSAKLQAVASSLEQDQMAVAYRQTLSLVAQIHALTQAGILHQTEADLLIQAINTHILDHF